MNVGTSDIKNTFDSIEYPFLNHLGATPSSLDKLIQEIVKYKKNNTIEYIRGNNRNGILISIPSYRKIQTYDAEFSKKGSVVENIIDVISKNCNGTKDDAAQCLLKALYASASRHLCHIRFDFLQDPLKA